MSSPLSKILIIRLSSIGDIVLATPLIRCLRSMVPHAHIDFLVKSEYAELVKFNPHVSSTREFKPTRGFGYLNEVRRSIAREKYDLIIDLHNSIRSRFLRTAVRAKRTTVVNKRVVKRFFLVKFKWNLYRQSVPVANRYLETVKSLGVRDDGKGPELFIPDETLFAVSSTLAKQRLDRYDILVGCAPGAKHNTKMWPSERYAEIALRCSQELRAKILLFGGEADVPRCNAIAQFVNESLGKDAAFSFAGQLSLLETAAALEYCDVVLCNDTGVMHLATARHRNVVAIAGPTVREFGFFPDRTQGIVIEQNNLSCRPCTHIGSERCPRRHFRCMADTSVDDVWKALQQSLSAHHTSH